MAAGWAAAIVLIGCVLLMHPVAEIGLHDDWSYIYTAKRLAETGHVIYNGWATAMLGWQLYLAAAFIRIFGFSFTVVRASTLLVAALVAPLFQAILLRLGVRTWNATVGTLTLVLSPLYLPLAVTYMSDLPALLCILLCLYCCIRALQTDNDRAMILWLAAAAALNVGGGTVRQIAWLGALVMVPATGWLLRRRRGALMAAAALWVLSLLSIFAMIHWFNHQPYTAVEKLFALQLTTDTLVLRFIFIVAAGWTIYALMLPVMVGILWTSKAAASRKRLATVVGASLIAMLVYTYVYPDTYWLSMLLGDYLTATGILELPWLLGHPNSILPPATQAIFALIMVPAVAFGSYAVGRAAKHLHLQPQRLLASPLFLLTIPFLAAYAALIVTRAAMFDRYLLPIVALLLMVALVVYERTAQRKLPSACLVMIAVFAGYGIVGSHDMFARSRARLQAADTLRVAGVPRSDFRAGFEYDGWTQIDLTGYVNEPRIKIPADAYHPPTASPQLPPGCSFWFADYTPSIHARYELSNQPNFCFANAPFAPIAYSTWLPPHAHSIYILKVPAAAAENDTEAPEKNNAR